ncbi:MAG: hypothetical protein AAF517_26670, partial [Planctomycetota bacterium]
MRFTRFCIALWLATASFGGLSAQTIVGTYGTPVIDGDIESTWTAVPASNFQIPIGGGSANASLKMMHDEDNLYVSLWVSGQFSEGTWLLGFDSNQNLIWDEGDDVFGMVDGTFVDRRVSSLRGRLVFVDDTTAGGTRDGTGRRRVSIARTTYEIRRPLVTGDAGDAEFSMRTIRFFSTFDCRNCTAARFPNSGLAIYRNGLGLATYRYSLEGPISNGSSGTAEVVSWIVPQNITNEQQGVSAWELAITAEGSCSIYDFTKEGTGAEDTDEDPTQNGYFNAQLLPNGKGITSYTLLAFGEPEILPLNEPSRALRFFVAPSDLGCGECRLQYENNVPAPAHAPRSNEVTVFGYPVEPSWDPKGLEFDLCGCFASTPHRNGWFPKTLGDEPGTSRNPYLDRFDLCSEGSGYGLTEDSVRVVSRWVSPLGLDMTLEDLSEGGQASLEVRREIPGADHLDRIADDAKVFRITVHRRKNKLEMSAGFRPTRGGAMVDVPVQIRGAGEFQLPLRMQIRYLKDQKIKDTMFVASVRNEDASIPIGANVTLTDWN